MSRLSYASPLLEKEGHILSRALLSDRGDPLDLHGPSPIPALATDNYPLHALQIESAQVFKERFNGEEIHPRVGVAQC